MRSTIISVLAIASGVVADDFNRRGAVTQIGDGQIQAPSIYSSIPAMSSPAASSTYSVMTPPVVVPKPTTSTSVAPPASSVYSAQPQPQTSGGAGSGGTGSGGTGSGGTYASASSSATAPYQVSSVQPASPPATSAASPPYVVNNGTAPSPSGSGGSGGSSGSGGSGGSGSGGSGSYSAGQPQTNSVAAISVRAGLMSAALAGVLFMCA